MSELAYALMRLEHLEDDIKYSLLTLTGPGDAKTEDIRYVIDTMATFSGDLKIQQKACDILYSLATYSFVNQSIICELQGLVYLVKAMSAFPKCQYIQETACGLLSMMSQSGPNAAFIMANKGVEHLVMAMARNIDSKQIHEHAFSTLYYLSHHDPITVGNALADERLSFILQASMRMSTNSDLHEQGAQILNSVPVL